MCFKLLGKPNILSLGNVTTNNLNAYSSTQFPPSPGQVCCVFMLLIGTSLVQHSVLQIYLGAISSAQLHLQPGHRHHHQWQLHPLPAGTRPLGWWCRFRHRSRQVHHSLQTTGQLCVIPMTQQGKVIRKDKQRSGCCPQEHPPCRHSTAHRDPWCWQGRLQSCTLAPPSSSQQWDFDGVGNTSDQAHYSPHFII